MIRIRHAAATLIVMVLSSVPLTASAAVWMLSGAALPFGDGLALLTWVLGVVMGFLGLSGLFLRLLVQPTMERMVESQRQELAKVLSQTADAFSSKLAEHAARNEKQWAHHHADPAAHPAGSSARIDPIRDALHVLDLGQRELLGKMNTMAATLNEDSAALSEIDARLANLEHEHCILHGVYLKRRASDPPSLDPEKLRGKE